MEKIDKSAAYVEQMSELLDLPLDPEYFPGVVKNFATISAIATLVMEFPLPEDIEAAPIFEP
jgi:precorrin-4 methylase